MEQIHLLINDSGEVEIVKTKYLPVTNTKPSRIKVTPSNFSLEDCGKSVTVGRSGAETRDCIERAMPGWKVISQGGVLQAIKNYFRTTAYVAIVSCGRSDNRYVNNVYAGESERDAKIAIDLFDFPSEWNRFGGIEKWVNGKLVKTIEIEVK